MHLIHWAMSRRIPAPQQLLWLLPCAALLAACATPALQLSSRDPRTTVVGAGCWPGSQILPHLITVTPHDSAIIPDPGCTPVPTLGPYPTQEPIIGYGGSQLMTALELPFLQQVEVAVHPSQGWAAVASVWTDDQNGSDGGPSRRIFVRVFSPRAHAWGLTQQVNPPPAEDGDGQYGGVALAITGDGSVHVVWGGAFTPSKPVWYSSSKDYGTTWSSPVPIGHGCDNV